MIWYFFGLFVMTVFLLSARGVFVNRYPKERKYFWRDMNIIFWAAVLWPATMVLMILVYFGLITESDYKPEE